MSTPMLRQSTMSGYSGTPLGKKLGLKPPMTLVTFGAPSEYRAWVGELDEGVRIVSRSDPQLQAAHVFVVRRSALATHLVRLRKDLAAAGFVWISWPKRSSGVETDITEDVIRELALPLGFVDVKVCAVTVVWSGLKLVIRKRAR